MLSRKDTEELLSSLAFVISCLERVEQRLGSVEKRLKSVEIDHDRLRNSVDIDEMVRVSRNAREVLSALDAPVGAAKRAMAQAGLDRVAVVVPVYNAPAEVAECLAALFENGGYDELIVVDDGSDAETKQLLARQQLRRPFRLITNPKNIGYTKSVNVGVRQALGHDVVVVLNSDTVTTFGWIGKILAAFTKNDKVGIVGPLSNAASYQSIPAVKGADGTFVTNALPDGLSADDVAIALRDATALYPRVPIINGFCLALRGTLLKKIGLFDEDKFPVGYGEENDFCLRAAAAGFELAVADDAFVFHSKSASFGAERRQELAKRGRIALEGKHGADVVRNAILRLDHSTELDAPRAAAVERLAGATADAIFSHAPLSLAYVLPAKPGGGGVHSIVQEANYLLSKGVPTMVLVPERELAAFLSFYAEDGISSGLFVPYRTVHMARDLLAGVDAVVATVYRSVALVRELMTIYPEKKFFYYVQDYEPYFHPEGTDEHREATESYDLDPSCRFFAKTRWLRDTVFEKHGRTVDIVLPSLDREMFRPGTGSKRKNQIAAMVRPSTQRRRPAETVAFAEAMSREYDGKVSVALFGEDPKNPIFDRVRDLPGIKLAGRLTRPEVAKLFRASDAFVDLSEYQAFGRASLEAMATGATAIVPKRGGATEYAIDGWNAVVVDTETETVAGDAQAAIRLIYDRLPEFKAAARETAAGYSIESAARSIYKFFLNYGAATP